ncbi:nitrate/sulfonate/bicarbonate ABC transporter ATP-binding protein [[Bacillus] enclensis]|uniref:Carnitine transport ATP-binding protein OpuCA n=1 Tax=[Bacillus] enclensis TaxID=1402860 RepID=A0A0V8HEJ7_9BACI|nr:ABC transporter ATP-binding protein [[Bacillus] enclensis]KSU61001.1 nitrate/sulfonate/bicarbonate ABC transporter ATP-binding protein [[Bacillus] enclensis]SCC21710.1 NitT/TauT family transport system ATP-binding protein [[Bacillus] enclensis]
MFIQIEHLNKQYNDKTGTPVDVLKDINLEIDKGEFVSILGPSGCGKSTLLSIVAGLTKSTTGEITVGGNPIKKPGKDRGMVFQQAALFPWLNVRDNVTFPLKKEMSKTDARQQAAKYLHMVQLGNYQDHYPHELSGGMQQRVAIARALAMDPEVLLMDEPFGALDEQTRSRLHGQLETIWMETKKTVLFVTHSISESIKLSDRIIVMGTRPGTILADIKVEIPRPRDAHKEQMVQLEEHIMSYLKKEIDKVISEELAHEHSS